ncbi:phage holin family protein [Pseudoxanthomonas winnipegensis]|uniref:Phage holin family protein n=1 Tax=Pseudoxanthomonas winnipegensis TaxID=2480810 RepID=A0A4Q8LLP9_9GAMM|nr:phage holin family protein [Pseudoxanthomonas winnipegensis]RZZ85033.1 phage holin family protein [Pseudoxanthomonas winnipegensis]TAA31097.1 phage holin family protein [Pseudoxanthomonas winnipegensis]TAA38592.1 phage holin family protein [Pseudoxanthomonas winnipegensis]TBV77626.1 phage holin family protein [Pseudoxanthomonas winnipegensis]
MSAPDHDAAPGDDATPSLDESLRRVGKAGKDSLSSAVATAKSLRRLVVADFALARASLARAMVWMSVAAAFGVSSWLLLMGALIALLQRLGLSWLGALSVAAGLSLAITALGVWQTLRYFGFSRMDATRRQLKAMGLGDDDEEDAGPEARSAAEQLRAQQGGTP